MTTHPTGNQGPEGHPLSATQLTESSAIFRGELIHAEHAGYEVARRVWNGNIDRRPALIARCTGVADVQRAVEFARIHGFRVSVRGGGHSAPGYGTNDGGLVIDMSPMKGHPGGPAQPNGAGRGRCSLARTGPRNSGVRTCHDRRHRLQHRNRWSHARGRVGLVDGQARAHGRQPDLCRCRHGGRHVPPGQCHRQCGSVLGAARRRRQFRRRDLP